MKSMKLWTRRTLAYTLAGTMLLSASVSAADLAEYDYELPTVAEEIMDEMPIDTADDVIESLSDQDIILDSVDLSDDFLSDNALSIEDDAEEEIILDSLTEDMEEDGALTSPVPVSVSLNPSISSCTPDAGSVPDAEELITGYITKQMYDMNNGIQTLSNESAGQNFGPASYTLYSSLKKKIEAVAAGDITDTCFKINIFDYLDNIDDTNIYPEDLGLDEFPDPIPDDVMLAYYDAIYELMGVNIPDIIFALNTDCAYESYWWDRNYDVNYYPEEVLITTEADGNQYLHLDPEKPNICLEFAVSREYRTNPKELYYLDPKIPKGITSALDNAKAIVQEADAYDYEYEKMSLFKDRILALSDYNYDVAEIADKTKDHDNGPWQIIWVFDDDPETKVVCEGYAKAFQYLCDLSDMNVITVNGDMYKDGMKPGRHAWNIVSLEDGNYLVDITNCDTWGEFYQADLFLQGGHGTLKKGYEITPEYLDAQYHYVYDDSTLSVFTADQLTLSDHYFYWAAERIGHSFGDWKVTKSATALASGSKERTCKTCHFVEKKSIKKLTPTIKLSATKKTIKKKKSYTLKISNLAKGDAVKSVVSSKKTIATVKKLKTNQYKITAKKKKGTAVITVTLKSGKKATCKISVK